MQSLASVSWIFLPELFRAPPQYFQCSSYIAPNSSERLQSLSAPGGCVVRGWFGLAILSEKPPDDVLSKDCAEDTVAALYEELCRIVGGKTV